MLERTWLLGVLRAEREALGRTIQYTPPDRWGMESPIEGWSIREVVAHLAASDTAAAAIIAGEPAAEVEEFAKTLAPGESLDAWAFHRWAVERRADAPVIELATEWGRAADLLSARSSKVSDEGWTKALPWVGGDLKTGYLVQARVAEWWVHGEDLRAGGGLPPRAEHPPIHCVNDLAIRLVPYSLGLAGLSFPGASVQVELEHVGEGTWHQSTEAGKTPPEDKKPDAWITGQAHEFALVAANRVDLDVCLYEGIVNMGGDVELGEAVLRNLRSYV